LPIHHGEQLSSDDSDDIDLRYNWVSSKLAKAGYEAHWFGKWHTGFLSMNHLPVSNGFKSSVGSLQTGGAYAGPSHSERWQNDHPIYKDTQFTNKPAVCAPGVDDEYYYPTESNGASLADAWMQPEEQQLVCAPSTWHNNTLAKTGEPGDKVNVADADGCCAACSTAATCTFWVFNPNDPPNCHLKAGEYNPVAADKPGCVTGGKTSPHPPTPPGPPSPPGPKPTPPPPPSPGAAECTDEYSTDLWGDLAIQAVEQHDLDVGTLYVHLCFEAVHTPYDPPQGNPTGNTYKGLLWEADVKIGQLVAALEYVQLVG
jgi:hypothetical protein